MRWLAGTLVLAAAVGSGWWAGRATLVQPAHEVDAAPRQVEATVTDATVGRSVTYNVTVTQDFTPVASNALAGTVTHVGAGAVDVGDEIYSVDGTPVRVLVGGTPFWRDLAVGAVGPDVEQLEQALVTLGYLGGAADAKFTAATDRAVRAWQKATTHEQTGVVRHGEVVAVPALPTTVRLDKAVGAGLVLAGGEPVVLARGDVPVFALVLMPDQAAQVPPDAAVSVQLKDRTWPAVIMQTEVEEDGTYRLLLAAPGGGPVCGADCALLPPDETVSLRSSVALVPAASGPGVPVAAVRTDEAGATYVLRPDGTRAPVTVRGSGDGIAVVDGLSVGETVVALDASGPAGGDPTVPDGAVPDGS